MCVFENQLFEGPKQKKDQDTRDHDQSICFYIDRDLLEKKNGPIQTELFLKGPIEEREPPASVAATAYPSRLSAGIIDGMAASGKRRPGPQDAMAILEYIGLLNQWCCACALLHAASET